VVRFLKGEQITFEGCFRMRDGLILFLFALLFLGGCSSDSSETIFGPDFSPSPQVSPVFPSPPPAFSPTPVPISSPSPVASPSPTPASGTVIVNFVLQRAVPNFVQTVRVRFVTSGGNVVLGPLTQNKAAQLTFSNVTTSAATIEIDYLVGTTIIGFFRGPLLWNGTAGPIIINDPDFVDVSTLQSLTLDPPQPRVPLGRMNIQFEANGRFSDGQVYDLTRSALWSSTNATAAIIGNTTGLLQTRGIGSTTVRAVVGNVTGTSNVTVTNATITRLQVQPSNANLTVLQATNLTAVATLSDSTTRDVTNLVQWRTGNRAVGEITEEGTLTAVAPGTTTAEATVGTLRGVCNVTVTGPNLTSLTISPLNFNMLRLAFQQMVATATFSDGSSRDVTTNVTWTSSVPSGAAINSATGLVRALFPGNATLRAHLGLAPDALTNVTVLDQFDPNPSPLPGPSPSPGASPTSPRRQDLPGGSNPSGLAPADLNGDGRVDLAVSAIGQPGDPGQVRVLFNGGNATFGPPTLYGTDLDPTFLAAGVMRTGARPDLVVAQTWTGELLSMRNNGSGVFTTNETTPDTGCDPLGVGIADFNRDGFNDVATALSSSFEVQILLGDAAGFLHYGPDPNFFTTDGFLYQVAIGDFDGRNGPDVATATSLLDNGVTVGLNDGNGAFSNTTKTSIPDGVATGIVTADFTGDGRLDLAVSDNDQNRVVILTGSGTGTFTISGSFPVGSCPNGIAVGDFNADGRPDIVTANAVSDNVSILLGTGGGNFTPGATLSVGRSPTQVATADFDGDGRSDLVTTNADEDTITIWTGVH